MALGMPYTVVPEYNSTILQKKDRILICSDGLWDMLADQEIKKIVLSSSEPANICKNLIKAANEAGGEDNITAIVYL